MSREALSGDRAIAVIRNLLTAVLTVACLYLVWPQSLGGPVAFVGVDGRSMDGTYVDGDLIVVRQQPSYAIGDIVTFRVPEGEFGAGAHVIHRIVDGNGEAGFITQGDNRDQVDPWLPRTADIIGKSWLRIPQGAGLFLQLAKPMNLGALCAALTVFVMLLPRREDAVAPS